MPRFRFRSMDKRGQVCEGNATAPNIAALNEILRQQGQFLISASALAEKAAAGAKSARAEAPAARAPKTSKRRPIRDEEVVVFNSQFALMLRSAVPILDALSTLAGQQENPALRDVLNDVAETVKGGGTLTAAFGRHPAVFDQVYLSMLEAGESSGTLGRMIERISQHLEFKAGIRSRVKSALLYPAIVMGTAFLVVAALIVFVLPTFAEVFAQFDADLPSATRALLAVSESVRSHGVLWAALLIGSGAGARAWFKAERNRPLIDRVALHAPISGPVVQSIVITRIARTLGELLKAGVPILKALELTEATAGNDVFARVLRRMKDEVAGGQPIWMSLAASDDVPDMVSHLVAGAEKAGRLPEALSFVADFYQARIDVALRDLFAAIEPIFVLFLGLSIGGIAVTMLLPIFRLGGIVQ